MIGTTFIVYFPTPLKRIISFLVVHVKNDRSDRSDSSIEILDY